MRGSERLLFVGNVISLCEGTSANEYQWQPRRLVISEGWIYYFLHTSYQQKTMSFFNWDEWTDSQQMLEQMQERATHKLSNDYDSITQAPQCSMSAIDRKVQILEFEQFNVMLDKSGRHVTGQVQPEKVVCIIETVTKEVQYLLSKDAFKIYRAVTVSNAMAKVNQFTQKLKIVNPLTSWLQECINIELPVLNVNQTEFVDIYRYLIETTSIVNGIQYGFPGDFKLLQQLVAIKPDHIIILNLSNCRAAPVISEMIQYLQLQYLEQLDLSNNQIDDLALETISRLFDENCALQSINVSNNEVQGIDIHLEIFLLRAGQFLAQIKIDLSQNKITDQAIPAIQGRLANTQISLNLSYNKFSRTGLLKLKSLKLDIVLYPLPFTMDLFLEYQTLHLTRQTNKAPINSNHALMAVRDKEQTIYELFDSNAQEPPIESVYQLCQELEQFNYQISQKVILKMQEWIWHKLNSAILMRDHYSINYLTFSAHYLDLDTSLFQERYLKLSRRIQNLEDRINRLINLEVPEPLMNQELDDIINKCQRLDIRGPPVDFLVILKLQRDDMIQTLLTQNYDWRKDIQDLDPCQFLQLDLPYFGEVPEVFNPIEDNLLKHQSLIDYQHLANIPIQEYQYYSEILTKIQIQEKVLKDKDLISNYHLEAYEHHDYSYLLNLAQERVRFILHHQLLTFDEHIWTSNQDMLINMVRLLVDYNSHDVKRLQFRTMFEKLDANLLEKPFAQILSEDTSNLRLLIGDVHCNDFRLYWADKCDIIHSQYPFQGSHKRCMLSIDDEVFWSVAQDIKNCLKFIFSELSALSGEYNDWFIFEQIQWLIDVSVNAPHPNLIADEILLQMTSTIELNGLPDDSYELVLLLMLYIPPSLQMLNYIQVPERFSLKLSRIRSNWITKSPMPFWLPSVYELQRRIRPQGNVDQFNIEVHEFCTTGDIMSQIYLQIQSYNPDSCWIYLDDGEKSTALMFEMDFLFNISVLHPSRDAKLRIKRRIFSFRFLKFDWQIHDLEFVEQMLDIFKIYSNPILQDIELLWKTKQRCHQKLLANSKLTLLTLEQLRKTQQGSPKNISSSLTNLSLKQLHELIATIGIHLFLGSHYDISHNSYHKMMQISHRGITLYTESSIQQILFQEIIGIVISHNHIRITATETFLFIMRDDNALQCYQDILSYMEQNLCQNIETIYAHYYYCRMVYREQMQYCELNNNDTLTALMQIIKEYPSDYQMHLLEMSISIEDSPYVLKQVELRAKFMNMNSVDTQFVFQKPCPLLEYHVPSYPTCIDIAPLIEKRRSLFDQFREQIPNSNNTSMVRSRTQKPRSQSLLTSKRQSLADNRLSILGKLQESIDIVKQDPLIDTDRSQDKQFEYSYEKNPPPQSERFDYFDVQQFNYEIAEISEELNEYIDETQQNKSTQSERQELNKTELPQKMNTVPDDANESQISIKELKSNNSSLKMLLPAEPQLFLQIQSQTIIQEPDLNEALKNAMLKFPGRKKK